MQIRLFILSVFFIGSIYVIVAQPSGCTDPKAINYNQYADINDGSCIYEPTNYAPEYLCEKLPGIMNETSGLIFYEGSLWTHNDSGGKPELYRINMKSCELQQTILIEGAKNFDWEDVAQDEEFIYIADAGNNNGRRKELVIFKVRKSDIPKRSDSKVNAERIVYSYGDQKSFKFNPHHHNFDCEAIISYGDSLVVFTKNWVDLKTRMYSVPKDPGNYTVFPFDSINADGLITGAAINLAQDEITLIGYKDFVSFLILLYDFKPGKPASGNIRRIDFPGFVFVQTEGVEYIDSTSILISAENSSVPQCLYSINTSIWTDPAFSDDYVYPEYIKVDLVQQIEQGVFEFILEKLPDPRLKVEIYDKRWTKMDIEELNLQFNIFENRLSFDLSKKKSGIYFVKILSGDYSHVEKIVKE